MKIHQLIQEAVSQQTHDKYEQWKRDCKKVDPNCSFSGSVSGGQAVNWIDPGNKIIGDWEWADGKGKAQVYRKSK